VYSRPPCNSFNLPSYCHFRHHETKDFPLFFLLTRLPSLAAEPDFVYPNRVILPPPLPINQQNFSTFFPRKDFLYRAWAIQSRFPSADLSLKKGFFPPPLFPSSFPKPFPDSRHPKFPLLLKALNYWPAPFPSEHHPIGLRVPPLFLFLNPNQRAPQCNFPPAVKFPDFSFPVFPRSSGPRCSKEAPSPKSKVAHSLPLISALPPLKSLFYRSHEILFTARTEQLSPLSASLSLGRWRFRGILFFPPHTPFQASAPSCFQVSHYVFHPPDFLPTFSFYTPVG